MIISFTQQKEIFGDEHMGIRKFLTFPMALPKQEMFFLKHM